MLNEQCHQILAIDQQLQRTELEVDQLRQQRALRVQALPAGALQRVADQLNQAGYSLSVRGQQDWPWFSNVPQVQHEQTPLLRSASTSRESSPGRSCCADFGLVIDGDYPNFTDDALDAFKSRLAMLLGNEVTSRDISIRPAMRGRERSACVTTGSCEVEVNFVVFGSGGGRSGSDDSADEELDAEEERIEYILRGLISKEWPADVDVTKITFKVRRRGSIILVFELPQPLPVLLMQLAKQRSAELLEAVPGRLLCCQLGDSVERLEGCENGSVEQLAAAMEYAKTMVVPSDEATQSEPARAASETCIICGQQRSTCSYGDVKSFEPSIRAILFAEDGSPQNHFAALGLSVEQANDQDFASKVESAFRRLARVHPDKQKEYLDNVLRTEQIALEQQVVLEPAPESDSAESVQRPESDQRQPRKLRLLSLCCTAGLTHFFLPIRRRNAASCKLDASAVSAADDSAVPVADDSAVPVAEGSASLPPDWIRAGASAAFQRLTAAKETLLDEAARAAHVDEIRNGSVRRGKWECDAREALKEEDLRKQQIQRKAEAAAAKAKEQEKEAQIAGLFATLRACKPEDEVLPLINKATATQKDEVPLYSLDCI